TRAARDLEHLLRHRLDLGDEAEPRVVVEVREGGVPRRGRLRMVAKELGANRAPPLPARSTLGCPHLRVQVEDAPLPVQQLELGDHTASLGRTITSTVAMRSSTIVIATTAIGSSRGPTRMPAPPLTIARRPRCASRLP